MAHRLSSSKHCNSLRLGITCSKQADNHGATIYATAADDTMSSTCFPMGAVLVTADEHKSGAGRHMAVACAGGS